MKKILKFLSSPKILLLLGVALILLMAFFYEFKQQWQEDKNRLLPNQLIEKISKETNLKSIKLKFLKNSILRSDNIIKCVIVDKEGETWYSKFDEYFYNAKFLSLHKEDLGVNAKLIDFSTNSELFMQKPFSLICAPLMVILSPISSAIFMIYIIGNIIKNKSASLVLSQKHKVFTFSDIAGNEEEKEELKELVDFLKQPQKYVAMGAKIPCGVLLSGPPGTGKTLLAKALAGEAGVPFYASSGSEFVEMYVGLGAARIRNLFKELRDNAPCIIFIDEIDVLGGKRSNSLGGNSQEKDQTLNQLLTEMDGLKKNLGIVVIGSTNRLDMLDDALLRPGRFDRKFTVSLPDLKAREDILKVHARNKKLVDNINFYSLAQQTPGMSGAELATVFNEASILAVRNQKSLITMHELEEAIDRVLMGPAKKSRKYNAQEKKETAYHEAGHAVISLKLKDAPKIQKITIIPRGKAGGYVLYMTKDEEQFFESKKQQKAIIIACLGGRAAEELIFGDDNISDGCYSDLKEATKIARLMVTKYGMSDLGLMQDCEFADKKAIHEAMKKIIDNCYKQAQAIIQENKNLLDKIANLLLEQETITKEEIEKLI